MTPDALLELYRRMVTIRGFEDRVARLYADGEIPGFVHISIGQEASAAGACWPLSRADVITSTHRGHGHCIAKGLDPEGMFAELMAKETGTNAGRGGSMHICDPGLGIFGANGIVAAGLPIANGAAFAAQLRKDGGVVVAFFGDGASAQGAFHEAVNLAALWRLPVIFFCENNHYAEFSAAASMHPVPLSTRAQGYGVPFAGLDGNDVVAVATGMSDIVARVRAGAGPCIVEAETYRWHGHYEGDPQRYRTAEERDEWKAQRDPMVVARAALSDAGVDESKIESVETAVRTTLDAALERARGAAEPEPSTLGQYVITERPPAPPSHPVDTAGEDYRYMDAIREGLRRALEDDERVFLAGIDVGAAGNVFSLTRGLADQWPERVRDTPISETAVTGLGVGAAMAGLHPVVEIMYLDFIGVCFNQILNQAAKMRYMTGGAAQVPLTIRTQFGAGHSSGSQHSQSLEAILAHIPGLSVVMPSTPADAYGLLAAAIADPNPVIFIEHRHLYGHRGPRPPRDHYVPLGQAAVVRSGTDVTVVSVSKMVHECLAAAEVVADENIDAEVIDLRTVAPLDRTAVLESVHRTGRLVIAHEAVTDFGLGAEITALAATEAFFDLDAPVVRVGAPPTPPPYAPRLESAWLPDRDRIAAAVRAAVQL
jgi:2-oxoisovalerate dehydrogenase E1 component